MVSLWLVFPQVLTLVAGDVDLPGIDVIRSGYDAATWFSKGGSKYNIFDLSEPGKQVHVNQIGKTYTAPLYTSVVTDGPELKMVEDSCEVVATDFQSYLHTHFSSYSFDVGLEYKDIKLGLQYHKDVNEVYESITNLGQAIGVSESWWGMYQITLPPPFLLANKFDPLFQQARDALIKIGVPKSDQEQEIYNQVCCGSDSFGTHYVGSVIVGARASVTTFVNSSFHKIYSEKRTEEQISFGFEYDKFSMMGSHNASDFEKQLMEDFKNSSHSRVEWQPDAASIHSATEPWLAWQQAAIDAPAVVNMSMSSLAHLFFDQQVVMDHMQKTIDFYILNGKTPSLSDLGPKLKQSSVSSVEVPGLGVVGCGFHAPTLTSKICLFDVSTVGSTWSNPYYPNISYTVPQGMMAMNTPESLILNGSIIIETLDDYVEHSYWTEKHHNSGFLGFGSSTSEKSTDKYYRNFYAHRYYLALSMRQISWYTLQLMEFPLPPFSQVFQATLDLLPTAYDPNNETSSVMFQQFFEAFGTSVVTKADMGGLVWAESWFESCLTQTYSDICITEQTTHDWVVFHSDHHSQTCDKRIVEDFAKYSSRHYEMLGGTAKVDISQWEAWALTVKDDPKPVTLEVVPIFYLLPDSSPVKAALEAATTAFLASAAAEQQKVIAQLEQVRPPPAPVCKRDAEVGSIETTIDPTPQQALCPIVGYHGAFCPPSPSQPFIEAVPQPVGSTIDLPKGVGLTIDVSTGDLKLPAWDFGSAGQASWTDPYSNQSFTIPAGVQLKADVAAENVPTINVFKSEDELVAVWENGYTRGSWMGGEFGNSKSVSDLFDKFFSKQQSTSINQHPVALYRLTLSDGWEAHLNSFAMTALKALPEVYDANTYSRFIDTWGTHIATDTLVGGMLEQQVTMKDCVFQDPYLSGGLTDDQIHSYLNMDLAKSPVQDAFYMSRRQMSLDHRIGGNPEITDQSAWIASVSKDPALLKIYSYVDWANVSSSAKLSSAAVVANLQKAISDRLSAANAQREADKQATAAKRVAELQGPRPVVAIVAHGRRGSISPELETGQSLTLKGFSDCPQGLDDATSSSKCSTGVNIHSWNTHEITTPLRYERNAQGQMRSTRCFDLDGQNRCIDHQGPWVSKGCSVQPMANNQPRDFHAPVPDRTVIGAVCADCELIASTFASDATLKCVCPGYAKLKDNSCFDTSSGSMPNYKQCDPRWKCFPYAGQPGLSTCNTTACHDGGPASQTNNICGSGCGITSTAMVLSYFQRQLTPPDIAKYFLSRGFRNDLQNVSAATCNGVSHLAICDAANHWGLSCESSSDFTTLDQWLAGGPVIAHVRHRSWTSPTSCKFTKGGHYIVLTAKDASKQWYSVSDPNGCDEDHTHGTQQELSVECELVGFLRFFDNSTSNVIYA